MNAITLGLIAALSWGIHDITIRYLSRSVPILNAILVVLTVGAAFQAAVVLWSGEPLALSSSAVLLSVIAGAAFLIAGLGLYYAFKRGPVGLVAPLIATYPVFSVLFAFVEGRTLTGLQILAIGTVVAGSAIVAVTSASEDEGNSVKVRAILLSLLASFAFAVSFHFSQVAALQASELTSGMITRFTAWILIVAIVLVKRVPLKIPMRAYAPLGLMGLCDGLALLCIIAAASLPNPAFASVAASTFGICTIILAWVWLKERLSLAQIAGCALAFAGIGYLSL